MDLAFCVAICVRFYTLHERKWVHSYINSIIYHRCYKAGYQQVYSRLLLDSIHAQISIKDAGVSNLTHPDKHNTCTFVLLFTACAVGSYTEKLIECKGDAPKFLDNYPGSYNANNNTLLLTFCWWM